MGEGRPTSLSFHGALPSLERAAGALPKTLKSGLRPLVLGRVAGGLRHRRQDPRTRLVFRELSRAGDQALELV